MTSPTSSRARLVRAAQLVALVVVTVISAAAASPDGGPEGSDSEVPVARPPAAWTLPSRELLPPSEPSASTAEPRVASDSDHPGRERRDNPDPYVIAAGDRYLAFFTQGRSNVPLRVSRDWEIWSKPVDALPVLPAWARPGRTWAPAVAQRAGRWVLYFSAWHAASGRQCIGTATAASPDGPYEPTDEPIVCQLRLGGSIDPSPYADRTGSYLLWKSEDNALGRPSQIWSAAVDRNGTALTGEPVALVTADHVWEEPLIENPAMVMGEDGRRWLFYSAGPWETARYSTGLAACDGPTGPCRKVAHDRPWLGSLDDMAGPGGLDTFTTTSGETMAGLHAWDPDAVGYQSGGKRSLRIAHLDLTGTIPAIRVHDQPTS